MSSKLQQEYERRYASEMKFFTGRPGIVRAVCQLYAERLAGARVVDCGCGAGRSSFAFARLARCVEAFDYSAQSIEVCRALGEVQEPLELSFSVHDAMTFTPSQEADLVFMLDILEHVAEPTDLLARAASWLREGGSVVVSCPSFLNSRGVAWMILQECFDLCMSPTDVRQIFPSDMASWSQEAGFRSCELVAGACYGWGWTADAVKDMARRVRLALHDKRRDDPAWKDVALHEARLDAYLDKAARDFGPLLEEIQRAHGILTDPLVPHIRPDADCEFDPETVRRYLSDDLNVWHDGTTIEDDFFIVTREPWSRLGAMAIYELRV